MVIKTLTHFAWLKTMLMAMLLSVVACEKNEHHHHTTAPSGPISPGSLHDLDSAFENRAGKAVKFSALNRNGPVVLSLLYTSCASVCPIQAANMLRIQNKISAKQKERTQFIIISFDDKDTRDDLIKFGRRMKLEKNWALLRGTSSTVREFAAALGFQYRRNSDGGFSHSTAIYFIDSGGRVMSRHDGTNPATEDFTNRLGNIR